MPFGIDFDHAGNIYIVEMAGGERVLKIDGSGLLSVVGGTGEKGNSGDGGRAEIASFNGMHNLAVGPSGDIFVADTWNNRVRRIEAKTGRVFPFAGSGMKGFSGDGGTAESAQFGGVYCLAFDPPRKNLYLADLDNRRIRAVNLASGQVTTVAGNGQRGRPQDNSPASKASLMDPRAVAVDGQGRIYILERSGHALRMVDQEGRIHTVAGTGMKGFSGDGGDALSAAFNGPKHICVDRDDNVVIADTDNHVIRKFVAREKKVILVAGSGKRGAGGVNGPASELELDQPHGVAVDQAGILYIADSLNNRVLKIVP
jgi:DNA-binding beta-propeller fold protein YncE